MQKHHRARCRMSMLERDGVASRIDAWIGHFASEQVSDALHAVRVGRGRGRRRHAGHRLAWSVAAHGLFAEPASGMLLLNGTATAPLRAAGLLALTVMLPPPGMTTV